MEWETSLTARSAVYFTIRIFCDMFDEDALSNGNEHQLFGQCTQLELALEVVHPFQNVTRMEHLKDRNNGWPS